MRINLKNQVVALTALLFITVGSGAAILLTGFDSDALLVFGIMWLAVLVPTIFLHVEYFVENRGMVISIDKDGIDVESRDARFRIEKSDIKEIFLSKSASTLTPMESYHFARIVAKEKELVITNLVVTDVEEVLKSLDFGAIRRERKIFSSISLSR